MKTLIYLLSVMVLITSASRAELTICHYDWKEQPGMSPVKDRNGGQVWVSKPLASFPNPAEVTIEQRLLLASSNARYHRIGNAPHKFFTFGFTPAQVEQVARQLPKDKTSRLVVVLDGFCLGYTPRTRDWAKWGIVAGHWSGMSLSEGEVKQMASAGIKVNGTIHMTMEDVKERLAGRDSPAKQDPRVGSGPLEELICSGKVDNPVLATVTPSQTTVLCLEPVQAAISLRNIGVDQSSFEVALRDLCDPSANLKAVSGIALAADAKHQPPDKGEDRPFLHTLQEGESSANNVNLTRALGCEYANAHTGPLSLQFRVETVGSSPFAPHNSNAWLDLPAPEVRAVAFAEEQFQALQTVTVTGANDKVRLGTHPLDAKTVTAAVYSKGGAVRRILRLDPNPDTKTWEMAWDAKAQQLHILGHGTRARYWMSAADQLGWEVRIDVADRSRLETTDGQVRRVE